ncbi:MAG: hypothetical protein SGJ20_08520, partial [Planctomycetota bacterium]|nr:hypothetical protein [Planctomycetota bacterium]
DEFDDDDGSNVEDADTETEVKRTAESDRQARRRARNAILPAGRASSEATDGDSTADKKPPRKTASPTGDATSPPRGGPVIRPILDVRKSSIVPPWMRKDADLEDDESPDDENDDDDIVASSEAQQRPPRAAGKPGFRPKRRPHASLKSPQSSRSSKDRAARTDKPRQSKGEHAAHEQADTQRGQRPDKRGAGNYRGESSRSESAGEGRSHGSARGKQKSARPGPPRDGASAGASSRPARFKAGSAKAGASRGGPPKGNTARGGTPKGGAAKGGAGKTARPTPGGRGRIQSSTTKKSGSKPATARGNNRKSKGKGR